MALKRKKSCSMFSDTFLLKFDEYINIKTYVVHDTHTLHKAGFSLGFFLMFKFKFCRGYIKII